MWRDIYATCLNPEIYVDAENLLKLVSDATATSVVLPFDLCRTTMEQLCNFIVTLTREQEVLIESKLRSSSYPSIAALALFSHTAPFASALGSWLQGLSCPENFEEISHLKFLTLLADDIGVGVAETSRTDAYRDIARRVGHHGSAIQARDLVADRTLRDGVFRFPAILYALSRRSEVFFYELVGIDLALRTMGLHPVWRVLARVFAEPSWCRLDLSLPCTEILSEQRNPKLVSKEVAYMFCHTADNLQRIKNGIVWVVNSILNDIREYEAIIAISEMPNLAMADLVQQRAPEAAVYHEDYRLEGKPLNVWFNEASDNPTLFLKALGRSSLVRAGYPERSPLIGPMIQPSGRMFRVFRSEDVETISRWIRSLADYEPDLDPELWQLVKNPAPQHNRPVSTGNLELGETPQSIREAYYLLQGRALPPRTRNFARDYTKFWLAAARRSIDRSDRSLPKQWILGTLRDWLLHAHFQHDVRYRKAQEEPIPDRNQVIDQALQLAPLTLIDGGWLQGFTEVSYASSRVGAPLFQTYWDELGNGDWSINHPKIYRDLLASMNIILPATGSKAFSQDERLLDSSFRLPVFWLCVGKMPASLRPEILGLNLAMELSGVGGSYRSARKFLKFYGFSTQFVDLHNTIDNVSTGHSAWAVDAIESHMITSGDFVDRDEEWERVRAGYEALSPIVKSEFETDFFHYKSRKVYQST